MRYEMENRWHVVKARLAQVASGAIALATAAVLVFGVAGCSANTAASSSASESVAASASASADDASDSDAGSGESAEAEPGESSEDGSDDQAVYGQTVDESTYDLEYTNRDKDPSYSESEATKIDLTGTSASVDGEGVEIDGSTVTVTQEGVYLIEGQLQGQLVVDAAEDAKVQLVLAGASISNDSGSAVYVAQADKCFITLAEGTDNSLSDGSSYTFEGDETEPDATLFSTCDLTLQGEGTLSVTGSYNDAVKTKDDLVITGGTYAIDAAGDGLVGKDSVKIADGDITVTTEKGDGIKSSKDDDEGKGFVSIDGGAISVTSGDKGIKAETYLRIAGGSIDIASTDDALHSDGSGKISGGELTISAGDDAVHVEYELQVDDGVIDIAKCYEGYEGQTITVNGGDTHIVASDDGMNASSPGSGSDEAGAMMPGDGASHWSMQEQSSGDSQDVPELSSGEAESGQRPEGEPPAFDGSGSMGAQGGSGDAAQGNSFGGRGSQMGGMRGGMGGGMMDADESCSLTINGGTIVVESQGDGLDSNGSIVMNGGTVYVNGPTSDGDGALDCGTTISANGGTLVAVGSSGMAEGFTDGTQAFGQVNLSGTAGVELQVTDGDGKVIASFTPTKSYQNVVVTSPDLAEGQECTISAGDASATFTASTTATSTAGGMGAPMGNAQNGPGSGRGGQMGRDTQQGSSANSTQA